MPIAAISTVDHNKEQDFTYSSGIRKRERVRIHPRAAVEPMAGLSEDSSLVTARDYIPFCTSHIQKSLHFFYQRILANTGTCKGT